MTRSTELPFFLVNISKILFIILIFIPKFTLIKIPGYWQGIRYEELFVLFFTYVIFKKRTLIHLDYFGKSFFIFFIYFLFSSLVGYLNGVETKLILYLRYLEYLALLIIFNTLKFDIKFIVKLFKALIIVNFIIAMMQYQGIIGAISSKGYFPQVPFGLPYGLFGGTWELSICLSLSYFIVANFSKDIFSKCFYLILVLVMIYITQNKGNALSFLIALTFLLIHKDKKLFFTFLIIAFVAFFFFLNDIIIHNLALTENKLNPLALPTINQMFIATLINFDFKFIYDGLYNLFVNKKAININELPNWEYLSFKYRIDLWLPMYENYLKNDFTILFGQGFGQKLYIESFIMRIIFSFGILGIIIILYLIRNLPFYLIIYICLAGITLDLFISMKIFIITAILIYSHKRFS